MATVDLFDTPLRYNMTEEETQAYQLAVFWTQKVRDYFPDIRHEGNRLCQGDPRKCLLFRHCIKLIRETRGLIEPKDYRHYIVAQLYVFKKNSEDGETCLVSPNMLTGKPAWRRWKLFESALKKVKTQQAGANPTGGEEVVSIEKVEFDLKKSQEYLRKYIPEVTPQFLADRHKKGDIGRWLRGGFIRPYFVALSPTLKALGGLKVEELSGLNDERVKTLYTAMFPKDRQGA